MKRFIFPFLSLALFGASAQAAQFSVSDGAPGFIEGSSSTRPMAFTVRLSEPLKTDVSVKYATGDITATAPADYTASTGVVTFKAGQTSEVVNIPIRGDKVEEADERFRVRLSAPVGAVLGDSEGIGTVIDDDFAGKISIGPEISLLEGNDGFRTAKWTVSLSQKPLHPISVGYSTKNGGAIAPEDFTATAGTILFSAGNLTKGISVPVVGDTKVEKDETFSVKLVAPGYAFERDGSTAIIRNDDKAPAPTPTPTAVPTAVPTATPAPTATPNPPGSGAGKIVFTSRRDHPDPFFVAPEIYIMNADGTAQTRLTFTSCDFDPMFSPDGKKIVWMSHGDIEQIYVMNSDGTGRTLLSDGKARDYFPAYSPDGSKIVFASGSVESGSFGISAIWVMNPDGTGRTRLTTGDGIYSTPRYSPDGSKIVFEMRPTTHDYTSIWMMNADGSGQTRVTTSVLDNHASFSPDGQTILFASGRYGASGIYSTQPDGTNSKYLASSRNSADRSPCYSPDGKKIAFFRVDGGEGLYTMNADGTAKARITGTGQWDDQPSWSIGSVSAPAISTQARTAPPQSKAPSAPSS